MIRKRLGELLIEAGLLDEYQLQSALGHQRQWGGRVGQILVQMKLVDENRMVRVLATQLGVPMADPPPDDLHARIVAELSIDLVRQHHIFPLAIRRDPKGDQLALAMTDPTNVAAIDAVQFTTGKKVVPFLAGDSAIESWIRRHYHGERTVQPSGLASTVEQSSANLGVQFSGHTVDLAGPDDDDIPVVTGAMVAAAVLPSPLPTVPPLAADPFAGLAPAPGTAAAVGTIPSARFAAVVPGVSTSAFAGTGIAALDPVVGEAAGAWDKHVEQAPTAALVVPLPTSAPVVAFGPSDGFLGGNDDDDAVAPPTSPAASPDPFAALLSTSAIPPAPPEPAPPPPSPPASEPVLELADLELTEAMPDAPPSAVVEAPAAPAGPSWGDLLDASPVDVAPAARAESNAFARVPITADAFAPTVEELASASQAAPAPDVAANAAVAGPTCGRCGNPRVGAARFCPFCGLSFVESSVPVPVAVVEPAVVPFDGAPPVVASADQAAAVDDLDIGLVAVDEPVAPVVEAAPIDVDVAVAPVEDLDIGLVAVDVPTAPVEAAPVDVAAAPVEDLDIRLVAVDVPTAPVVEAAPIAAAPVEDLDIGLVAVDVAPVVDAAPLEIAPVETLDIGLVAVDVAPVVDAAPLEIAPVEALDIGLVAVDVPTAPDANSSLGAAPADDIDVDLVAVDDAAAVLASDLGDVGGNSFASQWADAAEQMIPRKETDRRNDVGWVPPSRELVVTPEPAAPAPEPLLAYRPAAPADSAPAAPAPWAVFAPALAVPPTPPEPPAPAAPAAPDAWVVGAAPTPNDVVDASTTPFTPAVGEAAVPDAVDDDVLVAADSDTVESIAPPAHIDDAPATLVADSVAHVPVAVVESAEPAPAALADDDLPSLDIDLDEAPAEAPVEAAPLPAPPPVASPSSPSSLPAPAAEIGWGDLIDAPDAPVLPLISVPTFMPPATLTPPPMHLPRPPTLEALVAPPALSAPLVPPPPTWPVTSHDDDPFAPPLPPLDLEVMDTAAVPRTPTPRPQKVTATMVMKLDPAEQRRLLELLLASSDISTDALSTPPKPADGDPES